MVQHGIFVMLPIKPKDVVQLDFVKPTMGSKNQVTILNDLEKEKVGASHRSPSNSTALTGSSCGESFESGTTEQKAEGVADLPIDLPLLANDAAVSSGTGTGSEVEGLLTA